MSGFSFAATAPRDRITIRPGQPPEFADVNANTLRFWLMQYEQGYAALAAGTVEEIMLYRHDVRREVAFRRSSLAALEQQIIGMRAGLTTEKPTPAVGACTALSSRRLA